jgi:hypothetical protein
VVGVVPRFARLNKAGASVPGQSYHPTASEPCEKKYRFHFQGLWALLAEATRRAGVVCAAMDTVLATTQQICAAAHVFAAALKFERTGTLSAKRARRRFILELSENFARV